MNSSTEQKLIEGQKKNCWGTSIGESCKRRQIEALQWVNFIASIESYEVTSEEEYAPPSYDAMLFDALNPEIAMGMLGT